MNAQQKLDDLLKVKETSKKLPPQSHGELADLLVEHFQEKELWSSGFQYMLKFPAPPVGIAFARIYNGLNEENRVLLLNSWFTTDVERNVRTSRQIHMICKLITVDQIAAWKLFIDLCQKQTQLNQKTPTSEPRILKLFYNELVNSTLVPVIPIDKLLPSEEEFVAISSMLLHVLAAESDTDWELVLANVNKSLDWLEKYQLPFKFPLIQRQSLEKVTMHWPNDYKDRLQGLGFLENVIHVSKIKPTTVVNAIPMTDGFDLDAWMEQIKVHWQGLLESGRAASRLRNERDSETRGRMEVQEKLKATEEKWKAALTEASRLATEVESLRSELKEKDEVLAQAVDRFEQEKNKLTDLTEQESQVVADQFRSKLSQRLRFEYQDFNEILQEPMTLELGDNLRVQLAGIFEFLNSQGIKL